MRAPARERRIGEVLVVVAVAVVVSGIRGLAISVVQILVSRQ